METTPRGHPGLLVLRLVVMARGKDHVVVQIPLRSLVEKIVLVLVELYKL